MPKTYRVLLSQLVSDFRMEILYQGSNYAKQMVATVSINRPGLALVGFYDYFDEKRIQLLGNAEYTYLTLMTRQERLKCFSDLLSRPIPALVIARNLEPFPECLEAARTYDRTILRTGFETGEIMSNLTTALRSYLSPRITRHGVLVEVYGEGVLLLGESGVGKSEAAVELIKRGHRLIADDAVEIRRTQRNTLIGSAPELIRYYVEMRGIGVIDVQQMFGVSAVKESQEIGLIINLEQWREGVLYDRMGLEDFHTSILDVEIPTLTIPIRPGRNLSVIIEVAALNNRQKRMGYNAAQKFTDKINEYFERQMAMEDTGDFTGYGDNLSTILK